MALSMDWDFDFLEHRRWCFVAVAIAGAAVVGAGASLASGAMQSNAAQSAASTQASAANAANAQQASEFAQTEQNLAPFISTGQNALGQLANLTGTAPGGNPLTAPLTKPFTPQDLTGTPGYKFTLQQGLEAVQNAFAAQGLGSSGVALKGATNFAEGLAGTTYNQQLANYLNQNQQIYNMLQTQAGSGQNAAAGLGALGQQNVNAQTALSTSGAAAQAAGTVGSANAIAGSLGSLSGTANTAALLMGFNNSGMFGPGTSGAGNSNPLTEPVTFTGGTPTNTLPSDNALLNYGTTGP